MTLKFLRANQSWVFVFGDSLVRLEGRRVDADAWGGGGWPLFYDTRQAAVDAARRCGLWVEVNNEVVVEHA